MTKYLVFDIECDDEATAEILIALLAAQGFDSFVESDGGLEAYAALNIKKTALKVLDELMRDYSFTYSFREFEDRNWNEVWESHFAPIKIGEELLLRASFHPSDDGVDQEIVIDPKMAFGTGHHATTYMMCERVLEYFRERKETETAVLDYGAGTGVLAILSKRLGATRVDAVDIELPSYENTLENAISNGVSLDTVVLGELKDVPLGQAYDLVLANINRNVLLETAPALCERLRSGGAAFLSGILASDAAPIVERMNSVGLRHLKTYEREDWRSFVFIRE